MSKDFWEQLQERWTTFWTLIYTTWISIYHLLGSLGTEFILIPIARMTHMTPQYILNPDGSFMDADRIVLDLVHNQIKDPEMIDLIAQDFMKPLSEHEREMYAKTNFQPYFYLKTTMGRWIRNTYGLWDEKNPHTMKVCDNSHVVDGVDYHPNHPDNYSGTIMSRLVQYYSDLNSYKVVCDNPSA